MGLPGGWELIIIFIVILLLFGAKRLPDLAKGLGKGISEFRKAKRIGYLPAFGVVGTNNLNQF